MPKFWNNTWDEVSKNVLATIENLSNIEFITTYYRFRLLQDEDDDKFVDCAIAANANYIVTHDKDFNVLAKIDFPKVQIKNTDKFKEDIFD
jgi:putative PIN family toxin of toxin-antitoxin system